jgi:hypothetical protein
MLPTNEKAEDFPILQNNNGRGNQLYKPTKGYYYTQDYLIEQKFTACHLYILSDEEIKEGDWFIANKGIHKCLEVVKGDYPYKVANQYNGGEIQYQSKHWIGNKIIATTDKSLVIGREHDDTVPFPKMRDKCLPQPSQAFIEKYIAWWNQGDQLEEVMVEYEKDYSINEWKGGFEGNRCQTCNKWYYGYSPKPCDCCHPKIKHNTITIKKVKDSWSKEEVIEVIFKVLKATGDEIEAIMKNTGSDKPYIEFNGKDLDNWIDKNL